MCADVGMPFSSLLGRPCDVHTHPNIGYTTKPVVIRIVMTEKFNNKIGMMYMKLQRRKIMFCEPDNSRFSYCSLTFLFLLSSIPKTTKAVPDVFELIGVDTSTVPDTSDGNVHIIDRGRKFAEP
jgi:hypothetical protein